MNTSILNIYKKDANTLILINKPTPKLQQKPNSSTNNLNSVTQIQTQSQLRNNLVSGLGFISNNLQGINGLS